MGRFFIEKRKKQKEKLRRIQQNKGVQKIKE